MNLNNYKTNKEVSVNLLKERGVSLFQIAELTYFLEKDYIDELKVEDCLIHVEKVLLKREVQHAVITGIELDKLAEKNMLEEPLQSMLNRDFSLYGIDEVLALSIVNVYGSIGFTNFGYIDKLKPGILKEIDEKGKEKGVCHTFLDDIVGAIAAAAASRIAHRDVDNDI